MSDLIFVRVPGAAFLVLFGEEVHGEAGVGGGGGDAVAGDSAPLLHGGSAALVARYVVLCGDIVPVVLGQDPARGGEEAVGVGCVRRVGWGDDAGEGAGRAVDGGAGCGGGVRVLRGSSRFKVQGSRGGRLGSGGAAVGAGGGGNGG